jgi:hypothetical protein
MVMMFLRIVVVGGERAIIRRFWESISYCLVSGTQGSSDAHLPGRNKTDRTDSPGHKPGPFSEPNNPALHCSLRRDAPKAAEGMNDAPLPMSSELVFHTRPQPSTIAAEGWSSPEDSSWSSWR